LNVGLPLLGHPSVLGLRHLRELRPQRGGMLRPVLRWYRCFGAAAGRRGGERLGGAGVAQEQMRSRRWIGHARAGRRLPLGSAGRALPFINLLALGEQLDQHLGSNRIPVSHHRVFDAIADRARDLGVTKV
jgi:hypothetical protein